jgi:hypothetical protein
MRMVRPWCAAVIAAALTACVPGTAPLAPAPMPAPVVLAPPPAPAPAAPPAAWEDGPLSPGDWTLVSMPDAPRAEFQSANVIFGARCERGGILIGLTGAQASSLTIRTGFGERRLPATPVHLNEMIVELAAADPLLDQMAFSRGRFLVQVENGPTLVLPTWPELARVIEECRR